MKRCRLKIFVIYSSGSHFVWRSKNIKAIFVVNIVMGIMRNISVKSFCIWTSDSGGDISHLELWGEILFGGAKPFQKFRQRALWGSIL